MMKRMSKSLGRHTRTGAFVKGLGGLGSFAHPPRRPDTASSTAAKAGRALSSDWDRIGSDFSKLIARERSGMRPGSDLFRPRIS